MTPRPFYRSRLFWLGLPGLVFLLWAWLANPPSSLTLERGDFQLMVGSTGRQLKITWGSQTGGVTVAGLTGTAQSLAPAPLFPRAIRHTVLVVNSSGPRITFLSVASWLILLAYFVAWLALLCYWQRRKSRLLKLHAEP